jgi:Fe-S cluster biosynthesis and repair protein YggX
MYSQTEHREKLKQEAKNYLFDQEFATEVNR